MRYSEWSSVPEYIMVQLKNRIISGNYKNGDRFLTEKEICEKYNVGRSSVREALRVLETLGYIDLQRGRGAFITKTYEEDKETLKDWYEEHKIELQDVIDVRLCIETVAIKNAIQRITPTQVAELKKIVEDMRLAVEKGVSHEFILLDEKFHSIIVEASCNKLLMMVNKQVQKVASEYRGKTYTFKSYADHNVEIHERILNFIINRDIKSALNEVKKHIESMKENLAEIVE